MAGHFIRKDPFISFWVQLEKAASESCALDRVLKAARVLLNGGWCALQRLQTNTNTKISFTTAEAHPKQPTFSNCEASHYRLKLRTLHLKKRKCVIQPLFTRTSIYKC